MKSLTTSLESTATGHTNAKVSIMALAQIAQAHESNLSHNDNLALFRWIAIHKHRNANTTRSYQREVKRFRLFLHAIHESNPARDPQYLLRDATERDFQLYEATLKGFTQDGPIQAFFLPPHILRQHEFSSQPFVTESEDKPGLLVPLQLKQSSVDQALSILHAMYQYWLLPDPQNKQSYVAANPVRRVKRSSNRIQSQQDRYFPIEALHALLETCQTKCLSTPDKAPRLRRQRWITALLFGLWTRRAEVATIMMNSFKHDGHRWSVTIQRKGGKTQTLPVANWVIKELMTYRQSLELTPLPLPAEKLSAIQRLTGDAASRTQISDDLIYHEICALAKDAAQALRDSIVLKHIDEVQRELIATKLDQLSPHWFRHSGASIAINTGAMSLENASKMLGHSSTVITQGMYFHPEISQMADGMESIGQNIF